jgi:hypothetical protein
VVYKITSKCTKAFKRKAFRIETVNQEVVIMANTTNTNDVSKQLDELWTSFLSQVPLGSIIVWGENLLSSLWPEFNTIKQQVLYFIAYAEAEGQITNSDGATKKANVVAWVMQQVDKVVPQGWFTSIIESVVSGLIDGLVTYLNTNFPGWEQRVLTLLQPSTTTTTAQ